MGFEFSLEMLSEKYVILRRILRDIIIILRRYSVKLPRYFCQIFMKIELSRRIFENIFIYQISLKLI